MLENICLRASNEKVIKAQEHFNENSNRVHWVIIGCEWQLSQFDDDVQSQAITYALEKLLQVKVSKGSKSSDTLSKQSNYSSSSEREKMLATIKENSTKCNFELLKKKQNTEEAEAQLYNDITKSELVSIINTNLLQIKANGPPKVLQITSYLVPQNNVPGSIL